MYNFLKIFTANKGFIPLSRDENKDQIFVQGNWYNKDGTTNKGDTVAPLTQISAQLTFQQCMHHGMNGCNETWSQVSVYVPFKKNFKISIKK